MIAAALGRIVDFVQRRAVSVTHRHSPAERRERLLRGDASESRHRYRPHAAEPISAWRQNELALDAAFPQNVDLIVVVIDGQTGDLADRAARDLAARMQARPDLFTYVRRPDGGEFFDRNGPLFLPTAELQNISDKLDRGAAADRHIGARSEPARPVRHAGSCSSGAPKRITTSPQSSGSIRL